MPLEPLDYEPAPTTPKRPQWLLRVPLSLLWMTLILPFILFVPVCAKRLPGQPIPEPANIASTLGGPIALTLAVLSYRTSSKSRQVGLVFVILVAGCMTCGLWYFAWESLP